jgi:hypothetical protein
MGACRYVCNSRNPLPDHPLKVHNRRKANYTNPRTSNCGKRLNLDSGVRSKELSMGSINTLFTKIKKYQPAQKPRNFPRNSLNRANSTCLCPQTGNSSWFDHFLSSRKNGTLNRVFRRPFYFPRWRLRVVSGRSIQVCEWPLPELKQPAHIRIPRIALSLR